MCGRAGFESRTVLPELMESATTGLCFSRGRLCIDWMRSGVNKTDRAVSPPLGRYTCPGGDCCLPARTSFQAEGHGYGYTYTHTLGKELWGCLLFPWCHLHESGEEGKKTDALAVPLWLCLCLHHSLLLAQNYY